VSVATELDASREQRRINLYEVLQVSVKASPEVVQAAYRALARAYHPDVNPSPDAARQMRQLNAAYNVLSDPVRRARYDSVRGRPMRARREPAPVTPINTAAARARTNGMGVRPVPTSLVTPRPRGSGPRLGRLLSSLAALCLLIGALIYILWLVAGALEDEPMRAMIPASEVHHITGAR
jgi:hypothetical protein